MKRIVFLVTLLFFQSLCLFPQLNEQEAFWLRVDALFSKIELKNKDKEVIFSGQVFVNELKANWQSHYELDEMIPQVNSLVEKMLERRLKPYEHIAPFLTTIVNLAILNAEQGQVKPFLDGVSYLLDQPGPSQLNDFYHISNSLLRDSLLSRYKNINWKVSQIRFEIINYPTPRFKFKDIDLICQMGSSRRKIYQTLGIYDPFSREWKGVGGQTPWVNNNIPSDSVYVEFDRYGIFLQGTDIQADSAMLYHKTYFPSGVMGKFEDNFKPGNKPGLPRFVSYDRNIKIPGISQNVDFEGGVKLETHQLNGIGESGRPARLFFYTPQKNRVVIKSQQFFFKNPFISALDANATIRYRFDSIFHPAISFVYDENKRQLNLYQGNSILSSLPFFSSYQRMEIQANTLLWNIDDSLMIFKKGAGLVRENDAVFISENYFRGEDFRTLQGIDPVNPLIRLYQLAKQLHKSQFGLNEYASAIHLSADQAERLALQMAARGFLLYDFEQKEIILRQKLFHWVDSYYGDIDFDNLVILSSKTDTNAILNLHNLDLQVFSVDQVILSDSQKVMVTPYNYTITLKENRNFAFSGRTKAGYFDFYSNRRNLFLYEEFQLRLPEIDSIQFMAIDIPKSSKTGKINPKLVKIESQIEQVSGTLQIDHPQNKSGRKNLKIPYPVFKTDSTPSYVFYDRKGRYKTQYPHKSFYYKVKPFLLNNLDNYYLDSLNLKGTLYSANIFKVMEEPLIIRPDYSLGIDIHTGKSGEAIYLHGGQPKGWFAGRLDLSHQGFRGDGQLNYLQSISITDTTNRTDSTDFVFFPERAQASVLSFSITESSEDIEIPSVKGRRIKEDWYPYKDLMNLKSIKNPFSMYNGMMAFEGNLMLKPDGLDGQGKAGFDKASLNSDFYQFRRRTLKADSSQFLLNTPDEKAVAIRAVNYNAFVDFDSARAVFNAGRIARIDFPVFSCYSNHSQFLWDMNQKKIQLQSPDFDSQKQYMAFQKPNELITAFEENTLKGPTFVALQPNMDSLQFISFSGSYEIQNNLLNFTDIPFIKSADAYIFLSEKQIQITPQNLPVSFKNARLITSRNDIRCEFSHVNGEIISGKKFQAKGTTYFSLDRQEKTSLIFFDQIKPDPFTSITHGSATVNDTSSFILDPWFDFYGQVDFSSDTKPLLFEGYYRILQSGCGLSASWIRFDTLVEPDRVILPLPARCFDPTGIELVTGIFMNRTGGKVYARFLEPLLDPRDLSVFTASGKILWDQNENKYKVVKNQNSEIFNMDNPLFEYHPEQCKIMVHGLINLHPRFSPVSRIETTGNAIYDLKTDSLRMNLLFAFDFPFFEKVWKIIVNELFSLDNPLVNADDKRYKEQLLALFGEKGYTQMINEVQSGKTISTVVGNSILMTDIHFVWDSVEQVFNYRGPISLLYIKGNYIGRKIPGYIQLKHQENAREDQLRILLRPDEDHYFYIDYGRGNVLRVYSTNKEFTDLVVKERESFNKQMEKDNPAKNWQPFRVAPVNRAEAIDFRAEMEKLKLFN